MQPRLFYRFLTSMKRPLLHGLFWFAYFLQDTFLHFTWMAPALPNVPDSTQFMMAVKTALVLLPPKLLIVYFITEVGIKRLLNERYNKMRAVAEIILVMLLSVALFRVTFHYVVYPRIYLMPVKLQLFNVRNFLISVLEIGYITGIAIALKLLRLQLKTKLREQNLLKEKLQTELKFLRSQTNPHFLFNTLNNIYALSRKKSDKTPEVVLKLSELLSFMLYETRKDTITVDEEIKIMEDYIGLEKIRYNERLSIRITKNIDNGSQPIAPLLLLPLVENAFKHGVSETRFDSFVNIHIKLVKSQLDFCVENTIEMGREKATNGNIGLSNIKRQLELMYKEHEMTVQKHEAAFKVNITINLNSYGKL